MVGLPAWINRFDIPRPDPEKSFVRCASRMASRCSWPAGSPPMRPCRVHARRLCPQGPDRRHRPHSDLLASRCFTHRLLRRGHDFGDPSPTSQRKTEAQKDASATFLTAQVDFSEAGDLSCSSATRLTLLDRDQGQASTPAAHGRHFNCCAPRPHLELFVNNYCLDRNRSVRPAALEQRRHQPARGLAPRLSRDPLQANNLGEKGGISVAGLPIDLSTI